MLNAHKFEDIYKDLGLPNPGDTGFVMLDTQLIYLSEIDDEDLYYSPTMQYAQGQVSAKSAHVTLLGGILPGVKKSHVDSVLKGWSLDKINITSIDVFNSPTDEEYSCVVAKCDLEFNPLLLEAHQRLSFLPHINLFPSYQAHLTIAYTKTGEATERVAGIVRNYLSGASLETTGLNYGSIE